MIYVAGGYDGRKQIKSVERFDVAKNKWELMNFTLPMNIESTCGFFTSETEFLLLGG